MEQEVCNYHASVWTFISKHTVCLLILSSDYRAHENYILNEHILVYKMNFSLKLKANIFSLSLFNSFKKIALEGMMQS